MRYHNTPVSDKNPKDWQYQVLIQVAEELDSYITGGFKVMQSLWKNVSQFFINLINIYTCGYVSEEKKKSSVHNNM